MKYAIQINANPNDSYVAYSAFQLIEALIKRQHKIFRVFFYQEGIYHAYKYITPADDELQLTKQWTALATIHKIDLVVCISAAQRRGLLIADEASRQGKMDNDLADGFRISGLGQLLEATLLADRFIVFG
ncbi:MAG: sulfurtransferase complex subunit TusD [Methylococcales symbiont of Hymedesmia sp. n. MRB-2018]|nr:MAG: sulfurtransferase complex subunit TusD [Methylococcales symbiont of Hymedesmia sp. n. MRB-2018]